MMLVSVLVLYDRKGPTIEPLATAIARGVERDGQNTAVVKRIEEATQQDLLQADAIVFGSPNWSGVSGAFKTWLDEQGDLWEEGSLAGKPGAAFTTGWGLHSGLEIMLQQLIHWMLACGMVVVGLPWSNWMRQSGSYYGATATGQVTEADITQAEALGERVVAVAAKLK